MGRFSWSVWLFVLVGLVAGVRCWRCCVPGISMFGRLRISVLVAELIPGGGVSRFGRW